MEKEFVRISGKDYAEAGIASGELKPVIAVKFARVLARRGQIGKALLVFRFHFRYCGNVQNEQPRCNCPSFSHKRKAQAVPN